MVVKYPCLTCKKTVSKTHKAICCDACNQWIHIKCNLINQKTYVHLQRTNASWFCIHCIRSVVPFSELSNEEFTKITQGKPQTIIPVSELEKVKSQLNDMIDQNDFETYPINKYYDLKFCLGMCLGAKTWIGMTN